MARRVNLSDHAAKRAAILDAADALLASRGYEQLAVQDILDTLHISKGAFYHYFDGKPALLVALIERRGQQLEELIRSIVEDQALTASAKLGRYLTAHNSFKLQRRQLLLDFLHLWYTDDNALVRDKLNAEHRARVAPWLARIIAQGIQEGAFSTPHPQHAARMLIALLNDLGDAVAIQLLAGAHDPQTLAQAADLTTATVDAMERLLHAPAGCLQRPWHEALAQWYEPETHGEFHVR